MKRKWPRISYLDRVPAKILWKCVNKKKSTSLWRTMTKRKPCAWWSSSKRDMKQKSKTRTFRSLCSRRWKNWGRGNSKVCRHFSSASSVTERSKSSTDRLTLKDSYSVTKTFSRIFSKNRQLNRGEQTISWNSLLARGRKSQKKTLRNSCKKRNIIRKPTYTCHAFSERLAIKKARRWIKV